MERSSSRALQIRPARLTAAALTFVTAALLLLVAAGAAHAAVWVIPTTGRAFPGTTPTAAQTTNPAISIDAAGNEYEGVAGRDPQRQRRRTSPSRGARTAIR